ncbi:hypothetical protein ACOMHN_011329 [Nucella lapillus]
MRCTQWFVFVACLVTAHAWQAIPEDGAQAPDIYPNGHGNKRLAEMEVGPTTLIPHGRPGEAEVEADLQEM